MIRKPLTWLPLMFGAILVLSVIASTNAYAASPDSIKRALIKLLEKFDGAKNSAPKQADELPSLKSPLKSVDEDKVLDSPLIISSIVVGPH